MSYIMIPFSRAEMSESNSSVVIFSTPTAPYDILTPNINSQKKYIIKLCL